MKRKPPTISIADFIKTGQLGSVQVGMKDSEVRRFLSAPDEAHPLSNERCTWHYGSIDLLFDKGMLKGIFFDELFFLKAPQKKQLKLDKSIVSGYNNFSHFVKNKLKPLGISYSLWTTACNSGNHPGLVMLRPDSNNTVLLFFQRLYGCESYTQLILTSIISSTQYPCLPTEGVIAFSEADAHKY